MTAWTKATLVEGRVEVEAVVRFKMGDADGKGVICETQRMGGQHPRAVVKLNRGGSLVTLEFENVAPGATIKSPGT